MIERLVVNE